MLPFSRKFHPGNFAEHIQARSQACVSGVAKFAKRNHVAQNINACFMHYAIQNQIDNEFAFNSLAIDLVLLLIFPIPLSLPQGL